MRKTLFRFMAVVTALSMLGSMCIFAEADSQAIVSDGFKTVLENEGYALGFNEESANTAVLDKKNNTVWYASPVDADSDTVASEEIKNQLKSQIIVSYYENQSFVSMDSYLNCVKNKSFEYSVNKNTLSVKYNIGDTSFSANILPSVISEKRMKEVVLSKLSEDEQAQVLKRYKLFSKSELDEKTYKGIKMTYPSIDKQNIYLRNNMPDYIAEEIYALFEKAGYTTDDLQEDCDDNGIENPYKEKPYFIITLDYKLTRNGMSVSFSPDKCEYLEDYKPAQIRILPYFGAMACDKNGFMLVPDGCGSLIELNNGKTNAEGYWKTLFGDDGAIKKSEQLSVSQPSVLPVFAVSSDRGSFLASVDKGYEAAGIAADVSGKLNSYNYVYSFYNLFSTDVVSLSSSSGDNFIPSAKSIFSEDIVISYMLYEPDVSYSNLAVRYREHLLNNNTLKKSSFKNADLSIEFLATAGVVKRIFGIPYNSTAVISSYSAAADVINLLDGISVDVDYKYALKGGYLQKSASKLQPVSLGKEADRKALLKTASSMSFSYYAQRAAEVKNKDAAKTLSRSNAKIYNYDPVSGYFEQADALSLVSSARLSRFVKSIKKSIKSEKISAVNLLDIGYQLHSDFNADKQLDRAEAENYNRKYLKSLSGSADIFVDTGSIFTFSLIDKITNIPIDHSGYKIEDMAIPFYQIVISGYLPYQAPPINIAPDEHSAFLRAVEYGAQLHYSWICELPKNTLRYREKYYGRLYSDWIDSAKTYAEEYRKLSSKIGDSSISDHFTYSDTLSKTVYENGISVFVNYGRSAVSIQGIEVGPESFKVTGGENQ